MRSIARQLALFLLLAAMPALVRAQGTPASPPSPPPAPGASDKPAVPPSAKPDDPAPDRTTADQDIDVGVFYMHKGDQDAAIPRFQDAVRKQPKSARARLLLAEAYE